MFMKYEMRKATHISEYFAFQKVSLDAREMRKATHISEYLALQQVSVDLVK